MSIIRCLWLCLSTPLIVDYCWYCTSIILFRPLNNLIASINCVSLSLLMGAGASNCFERPPKPIYEGERRHRFAPTPDAYINRPNIQCGCCGKNLRKCGCCCDQIDRCLCAGPLNYHRHDPNYYTSQVEIITNTCYTFYWCHYLESIFVILIKWQCFMSTVGHTWTVTYDQWSHFT